MLHVTPLTWPNNVSTNASSSSSSSSFPFFGEGMFDPSHGTESGSLTPGLRSSFTPGLRSSFTPGSRRLTPGLRSSFTPGSRRLTPGLGLTPSLSKWSSSLKRPPPSTDFDQETPPLVNCNSTESEDEKSTPSPPQKKRRKKKFAKRRDRKRESGWEQRLRHLGSCITPECLGNLRIEPVISDNMFNLMIQKTNEAMNGKQVGYPVVLPSFTFPKTPESPEMNNSWETSLPRSLLILWFFHALFHPEVCDTVSGKVSVFPSQVFKSEQDKLNGMKGYPVLAVHKRMFFRTVEQMYPFLRTTGRSPKGDRLNMYAWLSPYCCNYSTNNVADSQHELFLWSGTVPYTQKNRKNEENFLLIPAYLVGFMKEYFVKPGGESLVELFQRSYKDTPFKDAYDSKFEFEITGLPPGCEPSTNVSDMTKIFLGERNQNMCYPYAYCKELDLKMPYPDQNSNPLTLGYGVQLHSLQLQYFNQFYSFIHGQEKEISHFKGILNPTLDEFGTRNFVIKRGITDDREAYKKRLRDIMNQRNVSKKKRCQEYFSILDQIDTQHITRENLLVLFDRLYENNRVDLLKRLTR
jgi:hypothetical protein